MSAESCVHGPRAQENIPPEGRGRGRAVSIMGPRKGIWEQGQGGRGGRGGGGGPGGPPAPLDRRRALRGAGGRGPRLRGLPGRPPPPNKGGPFRRGNSVEGWGSAQWDSVEDPARPLCLRLGLRGLPLRFAEVPTHPPCRTLRGVATGPSNPWGVAPAGHIHNLLVPVAHRRIPHMGGHGTSRGLKIRAFRRSSDFTKTIAKLWHLLGA